MPLKLMYITNSPQIASIAQKYGVDRIWVDLESLGKEERQRNIDSVKSLHRIDDIKRIVPVLNESELLVRVNPINSESELEINQVIEAGADIIMLPMWKSVLEVKRFLNIVDGRVKTTLLLETKEATECIDEVLFMGGFDEVHIGLNDLHLSYSLTFMFELLSNGIVENLCNKIKAYGIPYGFGGVAGIGSGMLPAERIIMEHYHLGSTRVILSRSFCNTDLIRNLDEIDTVFKEKLHVLRNFEEQVKIWKAEDFLTNRNEMSKDIDKVVEHIKSRRRK